MFFFRNGKGKESFSFQKANYAKGPPPYNLTILKANKNVIISKKFANFLLTHPVATDYFHWIKASKNTHKLFPWDNAIKTQSHCFIKDNQFYLQIIFCD